VRFTSTETPLGVLLVAATSRGLCAAQLGPSADRLERALRAEYAEAALTRDDESLAAWTAAIVQGTGISPGARHGAAQAGPPSPRAVLPAGMPEMVALNPEQQTIVEHLDGPALVIAGAGSGKTRVIIHRVARLIERGVAPSAILMVTFTNKAAEEMKRRLEGLMPGRGGEQVMAGTFHSVANRFLRRYAPLVGYQHNFSILDESDSRDLIKSAVADTVGKPDRRFPTAAVVQTVLSMAFNRNLELGALIRDQYP